MMAVAQLAALAAAMYSLAAAVWTTDLEPCRLSCTLSMCLWRANGPRLAGWWSSREGARGDGSGTEGAFVRS
jgi:hypothetical protein